MPLEQKEQELVVMRGAQGSGKTYKAQAICQNNPSYYRVNRNQLRLMVTGQRYYNREEEKLIATLESNIVYDLLERGFSVIIDNNNLQDELIERYRGIAAKYNESDDECPALNIKFRIIDLRDTPLEVCIENNKKRNGVSRVKDEVIEKTFARFSLPVEVDERNRG